jgi:hypothetical protein
MANKIYSLYKKRTRAHVIADLSIHHVEGFILQEGHTVERLSSDYGYDLAHWTFDEQGYIEPDEVYFQVKASETLLSVGSEYVFDLDIRDYNLWMLDKTPVILILYDVSRNRAVWLPVQQYFWEDDTRQPRKGARSVRIRISMRQILNRRAIAKIRDLKWSARRLQIGDQP